jgi:hypothetical protein
LSTGINKTIEFYKKFLNKNKKWKKTKKY